MKILVADDDRKLNRLICESLLEAQFEPDSALSAAEAADKIRRNFYALALIDWMFDGEETTGIDLTHSIKVKQKTYPVMLLTGRSALADRVSGLDGGADDYLVKPFYLPEMVARVKALLRRSRWSGHNIPPEKKKIGDFEINPSKWEIKIGGKKMRLPKKEFQILHLLLENLGNVVSKTKISDEIWGYSDGQNSNTIEVHLRHLRSSLGNYGDRIETIRGQGYLIN